MKHKELTDHIQGSFLKRQYLEAFLLQSTYIEGLLRLFADFNFWKINRERLQKGEPMTIQLGKKLRNFSLSELINFLEKSNLISKEQKKLLNSYRERRNKTVHDLLTEIQRNDFEKELKEVCELGQIIINDKEFINLAKLVEAGEEEFTDENTSNQQAELNLNSK